MSNKEQRKEALEALEEHEEEFMALHEPGTYNVGPIFEAARRYLEMSKP